MENLHSLQDTYTLRNGVTIPCIGYGTFKQPDDESTTRAVIDAVECGYRHIDCASIYGNEASVGAGIRQCGIPRRDLFVTGKLWDEDQGYDSTLRACERSLKAMGLDYFDLYLIHWPIPQGHKADYQELNRRTWKAFERLYEEGAVRAIGVSNFLRHHLEPLLPFVSEAPMVNQLELHPLYPQDSDVSFCRQYGMQMEAWAPLIQGRGFDLPVLQEIAAKHQVSIPQVLVRWSLQMGFLPLPKTLKKSRMKENSDVFGFSLSESDLERIGALKAQGGATWHPDDKG